MRTPLISVVIPVYNAENYVSACVGSLLNQTYPSFEVVLVDDGSTDKTPDICDAFAAAHDNIRVIHRPNGGVSAARNTGVAAARGELLTFVDSDDSVDGTLLEQLYTLLRDSGADIASSGVETGKRLDGVFTPAQAIACILRENTNLVTSVWGKLFRRELFEGLRFPEGIDFEDYAVTPLLFDRANKIAHTGSIHYSYCTDNAESITHRPFTPKRMDYFQAAALVDDFLKKKYPSLLRDAQNGHTRCAVSFFKQAAQSRNRYPDCERALTRTVRQGIFPYLTSTYKLTSKAYGVLIAVCPPLARKLFSRRH